MTEREAIANELFQGGEDVGEVLTVENVCSANLKSMDTKIISGMFLHFQGKQIRRELNSQETSLALFTI